MDAVVVFAVGEGECDGNDDSSIVDDVDNNINNNNGDDDGNDGGGGTKYGESVIDINVAE